MGKSCKKDKAPKTERISDLQEAARQHDNRAWKLNLLAFIGGCAVVGGLGMGTRGVIQEGPEQIPPLVTTTLLPAAIMAFSAAGGRNARRQAERYEDQAFKLEVIERQTDLVKQLPPLPAATEGDPAVDRIYTIVTELLPQALREAGVEPQRSMEEGGTSA